MKRRVSVDSMALERREPGGRRFESLAIASLTRIFSRTAVPVLGSTNVEAMFNNRTFGFIREIRNSVEAGMKRVRTDLLSPVNGASPWKSSMSWRC